MTMTEEQLKETLAPLTALVATQADRDSAAALLLYEEPHALEALYALGHQLYGQARYDDAAAVFEYLTVQDHTMPRYAVGTAASLQMLGRHELALGYYGYASLLDPLDPKPVFHGCECLLAMGDVVQAREGLESVLRDYDPGLRPDIQGRAKGLIELLGHQQND